MAIRKKGLAYNTGSVSGGTGSNSMTHKMELIDTIEVCKNCRIQ